MTTRTGTIDRIVVGVDGSEQSKLALRWAGTLSEWTGAAIHAVTAWHIPASFAWAAGSSYVPPEMDPQADAERMLKEVLAEVFATDPPREVQAVVCEGSAAQALLEHSDSSSLLVVGSRGHGGFAGLLLGSVSSHCAEHAKCPVLVVHGNRPPVIAGRPE
ncbi:universal stress protein [Jatrophihabitans sp.]|uniref:universal stress protein n=1 Tax=Jatrophihabitans sp. TaxID=1932789 RepID=UPI002C379439|nr:universal stress protein [Jatrophihabitans sp.]